MGYTSPNEKNEYGYSHSTALLQFCLELECFKLNKTACHQTESDVITQCN